MKKTYKILIAIVIIASIVALIILMLNQQVDESLVGRVFPGERVE